MDDTTSSSNISSVPAIADDQASFEISNLKKEAVMDLDGNIIEKPSAKKWALVEISLRIAQDEDLINKVLKMCQVPGNHNISLEDYITSGTRFDFFLNKFLDIKSEYFKRLKTERQEKVMRAKEGLKKGKKLNKKNRRK